MTLEQYIEQQILPQYDAFDGGHKRDHAQMVIDESRHLAREHGADEQMAYVIAAYHDLGLRFDRETHHIRSGEILMADETLRQWFNEEQLCIMRDAIEDHRASSKHPPRTIYGAIVAEADRQINPTLVIHRTIAYSRKLYPDGDFETLYARSKEHLLDKYAEGGYMRLWLNSERNVRSLEELRAIIRDEDRLRALCFEWYRTHKTYKAVFLDWDDTIGDWADAMRKALRDLYGHYRIDVLYPTFEDYYNAYEPYNLELWGMYGRGEVSKEDLHFRRFYRPLQPDLAPTLHGRDKEDLAHEMGKEFLRLTNVHFSVLPGAAEVVRELAKRYPLTIISNGFKEVQYYKFAHSGLEDCFAHIIISEEVGINKPQPEIFRIALEMNHVSADEAIMIGDSYSSDIAGAKAAGIDQIWLHQGATTETATFIVSQLSDVLTIL